MIPVNDNLVFTPENINTSSKSPIAIVLRNQEFLTSKNSEFLNLEWPAIISKCSREPLLIVKVQFYHINHPRLFQ